MPNSQPKIVNLVSWPNKQSTECCNWHLLALLIYYYIGESRIWSNITTLLLTEATDIGILVVSLAHKNEPHNCPEIEDNGNIFFLRCEIRSFGELVYKLYKAI